MQTSRPPPSTNDELAPTMSRSPDLALPPRRCPRVNPRCSRDSALPKERNSHRRRTPTGDGSNPSGGESGGGRRAEVRGGGESAGVF